jgi:hypothetical protein
MAVTALWVLLAQRYICCVGACQEHPLQLGGMQEATAAVWGQAGGRHCIVWGCHCSVGARTQPPLHEGGMQEAIAALTGGSRAGEGPCILGVYDPRICMSGEQDCVDLWICIGSRPGACCASGNVPLTSAQSINVYTFYRRSNPPVQVWAHSLVLLVFCP